jgi:type IV pilus assembly protein PilN
MIRINLIPYRAARTQQRILQHIGAAVGGVMLVILISLILHMIATAELSGLYDEISHLRAQNLVLQKKIGKIRNLDKLRMEVERKLAIVDELQQGRFRSLKTLHALAQAIPENVWLTSIKDKDGAISLKGLGESNKAVANFMRALDKSPLYGNVRLQVIERKKINAIPVRSFTLTMARLDEATTGQGSKQASKRKPS